MFESFENTFFLSSKKKTNLQNICKQISEVNKIVADLSDIWMTHVDARRFSINKCTKQEMAQNGARPIIIMVWSI